MLYQRRISRIYNVPELAPGFVGQGTWQRQSSRQRTSRSVIHSYC